MARIKEAILPRDEHGNDPNDFRDDPDFLKKAKPRDAMAWAGGFTLSDAEINELKAPEWIIKHLVIRGHLIIVVAEPNGGKTTIFAHLSGEMVAAGYRVFYINADISGSDAAYFIEQSKQGGWTAMLPDLRPGLSMADVVDNLRVMNEQATALDDVVLIFDTLKKMADVISKRQMKELLNLLRSLTGKGATIILLGHTNKYRDADGKPIFEGTGDVRSDADELIYLIPQKHHDKSMTVSTEPDKVRGSFEPITFNISPDRKVTRASEYIDTAAKRMAQAKYEKDMPEIETLMEAMRSGISKQSELVEYAKGHRISSRTSTRILKVYSTGDFRQWTSQRGFQNNVIEYFPLEIPCPPKS